MDAIDAITKTEARTSRFFVGAGNAIALLIDKGLFHLLAGEGEGLVTAEDEDLTVMKDLVLYCCKKLN